MHGLDLLLGSGGFSLTVIGILGSCSLLGSLSLLGFLFSLLGVGLGLCLLLGLLLVGISLGCLCLCLLLSGLNLLFGLLLIGGCFSIIVSLVSLFLGFISSLI